MASLGVSPHLILEKLSEKIDSSSTGSIDHFQVKESLVRKLKKPTLGFMSDGEVEEVLSSSDGKQRLRKVVEILKRKGAEEYESFESILRKASLTSLAEELTKIKTELADHALENPDPETISEPSSDIKHLQDKLKEKLEIVIEENRLGTSDGDPSLFVVATEKLKSPQEFKHFIASSQNGLETDSKYFISSKVIENSTDVLHSKHTQVGGQWIVVNGMAGIGKSKFCLKLRKQILDGETHSNRPIVPLPIEPEHIATLSRANCGKNALCTIARIATVWQCQGFPSPSIQFARVCQYWEETRGRDVVFILDGIEKLKQEEDSVAAGSDGGGSSQGIVQATELCKLLKKLVSYLPMCTIVIATRPEDTSVLLPLGEKMFHEMQLQTKKPDLSFVEVLGFTPDDIQTYINRRFNHLDQQQRQKKKRLIALVHEFPVLNGILRIPKKLEEFCNLELLSCAGSDKPALKLLELCRNYLHVGLDIIALSQEEYTGSGLAFLCKLAFKQYSKHPVRENHLIDSKKVETFLGQNSFTAFLHHDVVIDRRVRENPFLVYHFASDAVQEYLAAVHLSMTRDTHRDWDLDLLFSDSPQMRNVLVFHSALSRGSGNSDVIKCHLRQYLQPPTSEITRKKSGVSHQKLDPWDLAGVLYESDNEDIMKDILIDRDKYPKVNPFPSILSVPVHSQYEIAVLEFVLKNMINPDADKTSEIALKKMEIIAQKDIHATKAFSEDDNLLAALKKLEIVIDFTCPPREEKNYWTALEILLPQNSAKLRPLISLKLRQPSPKVLLSLLTPPPKQLEVTLSENFSLEESPSEESPQEESPQEESPQEENPQEESPQEESPQEENPQEESPQEESPQEESPPEERPPEERPSEERPPEERPPEESPPEERPLEERPPEERPPEERPPEERPSEENPQEKRPPEERPQEQSPPEESPSEENPQEESPPEERPQEERPQEERPQEERPQEENPQEENPQEENPQEENPQQMATPQPSVDFTLGLVVTSSKSLNILKLTEVCKMVTSIDLQLSLTPQKWIEFLLHLKDNYAQRLESLHTLSIVYSMNGQPPKDTMTPSDTDILHDSGTASNSGTLLGTGSQSQGGQNRQNDKDSPLKVFTEGWKKLKKLKTVSVHIMQGVDSLEEKQVVLSLLNSLGQNRKLENFEFSCQTHLYALQTENATIDMQDSRVPSGTLDSCVPSGTLDSPDPSGTLDSRVPSGTLDSRVPSGTLDSPDPSGTLDSPVPSGTLDSPDPSGTLDSCVPSGTQDLAVTSGTENQAILKKLLKSRCKCALTLALTQTQWNMVFSGLDKPKETCDPQCHLSMKLVAGSKKYDDYQSVKNNWTRCSFKTVTLTVYQWNCEPEEVEFLKSILAGVAANRNNISFSLFFRFRDDTNYFADHLRSGFVARYLKWNLLANFLKSPNILLRFKHKDDSWELRRNRCQWIGSTCCCSGSQPQTSTSGSIGGQPPTSTSGSVASQPPTSIPGSIASQPPTSTPGSVGSQPPTSTPGSIGSQPPTSTPGSVASQPPTSTSASIASQPPTSTSASIGSQPQTSTPGSIGSQSPTSTPGSVTNQPPTSTSESIGSQPQTSTPGSIGSQPPTSTPGSIGSQSPTSTPGSIGSQSPTSTPESSLSQLLAPLSGGIADSDVLY